VEKPRKKKMAEEGGCPRNRRSSRKHGRISLKSERHPDETDKNSYEEGREFR